MTAGTARGRYQPGEPPGINPGEPVFTGAADPIPAEPVSYHPSRGMLQAIYDADIAAGGTSYWFDRILARLFLSNGDSALMTRGRALYMYTPGSPIVGDLLKQSSFQWGVTSLMSPDGSKTSTFIGGDVAGIAATSKHRAQAWDFLKWTLDDNAQVEIIAKNGDLPGRTDLSGNKYTAADPRTKLIADGLSNGRARAGLAAGHRPTRRPPAGAWRHHAHRRLLGPVAAGQPRGHRAPRAAHAGAGRLGGQPAPARYRRSRSAPGAVVQRLRRVQGAGGALLGAGPGTVGGARRRRHGAGRRAARRPAAGRVPQLPCPGRLRGALGQPGHQPRAVLHRPPDPGGRGAPPRDRWRRAVRHRAACRRLRGARLRRSAAQGHRRPPRGRDGPGRAVPGDPAPAVPRPCPAARGRARPPGVLEPRGGHFDSTYFVDATPVREETTVVGHAVRALYLLAGVVDVYLETGDRALLDSAVRQWDSMTATKTYLTGAVGCRFDGESFGEEYELPQDLVYGETCATIAAIQASWRLLLATGDPRFADGIERALFNLLAGSTSVERDAFFYNNPAQRRVARPPAATDSRPQRAEAPGTRPHWFACACCPPNIMRTIASLAGYVATYNGSGIQVQQYIPSTVDTPVGSLSMATGYPLDGAVEVTVTATGDDPWTLSLRVPAWCRGASATVNGEPVPVASSRGYLDITRQWRPGDVVALDLPVPVRLTVAHPCVDAVRGAVAIERGPVVYCFESPDQDPDVDLNRVELLLDEPVREEVREDFLGQRVRRVTLTAVPYHLWANRGPSVIRIFTPVHSD